MPKRIQPLGLLLLFLFLSLAFVPSLDARNVGRTADQSSAQHPAADAKDAPVNWFAVVAAIAIGRPSAELVAQLAHRPVVFPFDTLDALGEQLPRSLGATDEVIRAARAAQIAHVAVAQQSTAASTTDNGAANRSIVPSRQALVESNLPPSQGDTNSPYVPGVPECGHAQIENGTLFMVNSCSFSVTIFYTSSGTVWGGQPLSAGEHGRTGFSAEAVARVGGVKVYTCPGLATPVDLNGNGVLAHYNGEYRCHR